MKLSRAIMNVKPSSLYILSTLNAIIIYSPLLNVYLNEADRHDALYSYHRMMRVNETQKLLLSADTSPYEWSFQSENPALWMYHRMRSYEALATKLPFRFHRKQEIPSNFSKNWTDLTIAWWFYVNVVYQRFWQISLHVDRKFFYLVLFNSCQWTSVIRAYINPARAGDVLQCQY